MKSASCGQKKNKAQYFRQYLNASPPTSPTLRTLEVIRGRWTSPETPLQPLPTLRGPRTLKSIQIPIQSAEIRMRATSSLIQRGRHELKWRLRGRASGAAPDSENHLWDPTFVRRVDLGRGGATLADIKRQVCHVVLLVWVLNGAAASPFSSFWLIFAALLHSLQLFSKVNFA